MPSEKNMDFSCMAFEIFSRSCSVYYSQNTPDLVRNDDRFLFFSQHGQDGT
jgi:hypothetical protein